MTEVADGTPDIDDIELLEMLSLERDKGAQTLKELVVGNIGR